MNRQSSQLNLRTEPDCLANDVFEKPHSQSFSSAIILGLVVSLGTTGASLLVHPQQALAASDSNVGNQLLSDTSQSSNQTILNNLQSISTAKIPLKTQIIELPKLSLKPTDSTPSQLSSTVVSPLSPQINAQGKLTQTSSNTNLEQSKAESVNQIADSSFQNAPNVQPQPQTNVVIVSNLNKSRSIPELPALNNEKTISKQIYTVKSGDTIAKIADLYNTSSEQLIQTNQLNNPNLLLINQQLAIPTQEASQSSNDNSKLASFNSSAAKTSVVESLPSNSVSQAVTSTSVREESNSTSNNLSNTEDLYINKLRADLDRLREQYQNQTAQNQIKLNSATLVSHPQNNYISTGPTDVTNYNQTLKIKIGAMINPALPPLSSPEQYLPDSPTQFNGYLWPAQGTLTSGYGWRWGRMHRGIDIAAPIGTPIIAAASGEVVSAGWNSGGYGNLVKLKHPDGSVTMYAHNNKVLVSSGQEVKQGELIAEMGTTGYSTGPHLHFEIHPNGETAVNPIAYLPTK